MYLDDDTRKCQTIVHKDRRSDPHSTTPLVKFGLAREYNQDVGLKSGHPMDTCTIALNRPEFAMGYIELEYAPINICWCTIQSGGTRGTRETVGSAGEQATDCVATTSVMSSGLLVVLRKPSLQV